MMELREIEWFLIGVEIFMWDVDGTDSQVIAKINRSNNVNIPPSMTWIYTINCNSWYHENGLYKGFIASITLYIKECNSY